MESRQHTLKERLLWWIGLEWCADVGRIYISLFQCHFIQDKISKSSGDQSRKKINDSFSFMIKGQPEELCRADFTYHWMQLLILFLWVAVVKIKWSASATFLELTGNLIILFNTCEPQMCLSKSFAREVLRIYIVIYNVK